jgi:hypothetical protein
LDKLELEEQAVVLNNSLYLSDAAFTFWVILFLAKALPNLFTKALIKKDVSTDTRVDFFNGLSRDSS